ncbi:molybdopterin-dependent oxidoreductase [Xylophilus rhododendri]|uniref:Molybdopterin-dependent oxidoreductase n=1 Tax=Xylophilus rhododendri TaxID=2697032 RepID=A0A857J7M2_9BURK|nr:molybdopterin-dependent oxidoreductase [Xylophilus rhododendri]QHI98768.1 molybdopterin-dependent oxidoreductase [Xylophilus rhododendri]
MGGTAFKPGFCTLCRSRCGTIHEVRDDRLIAVRPDPTHPTGEAMCMKGRAAPELVHSPHRVLTPLRRTAPKGAADPGWVPIGWEEALSETARRLSQVREESGAEAVVFAVTTPSGTPLSDSIDWIERFVRGFGSPNLCYATEICNWHKDFAHAFTFGSGMPVADYENAELILLWGHNPANTWLAQSGAIGKGRAAGARMLVVDPRPTALARQADVWLPVRPGTDAALAMGLVRLLLRSERFDRDFVRDWTNGPLLVRGDNGLFLRESDVWPGGGERFVAWQDGPVPYDPDTPDQTGLLLRGTVQVTLADGRTLACDTAFELMARGAESYDPATVEALTGVAPDALQKAADLLGESRRAAYHSWTGIGQHTNATQAERAVATLYALTGAYDRIGGNRVRKAQPTRGVNLFGQIAPEQRAKALGLAERPLGPPSQGWVTARDVYRAVLEGEPYRLRAMVAFGTNPPVSQGDTERAREALKALEFHVHCDLFMTPAAEYADIFLPVNTPWEREGLRIGFEINDEAASLVQLRQRMVSPRGDSRSDNDIVFDLARRLGLDELFFGGSLEAGWNHMLEPLGITVAELRANPQGLRFPVDGSEAKYRTGGFATQTRRVELYSELLLRHGQPAVATHVAPAEPAGDAFPLVLSSAKNGYYCHSQHRSLVSLRKRAPDPVAEIAPALAAASGIREGDWVRISTRVGTARFVARLAPGLAGDVVVAEFGWWQPCPELDRAGDSLASNFNGLIDARACDPVSGSVAHRSFRCELALDAAWAQSQRRWEGWKTFRVAELRQEAIGVLGIHFEALEPGPLPDYRPGQHIETRHDLDGTPTSRAYSLTGAAVVQDRRGYRIAVRHQRGQSAEGIAYEGLVSGHLHRQLRVGDRVELRAPSGSFVLPRHSEQPLVLVAGGIGITPFVSLLESLPDGDPLEMLLLYANQNSGTHAFAERLAFHAARLPGLVIRNHYNAPLPQDRFDSGERLNGAHIADEWIARRARVYMCGPGPLMDAVRADLVARGMPAFDIFSEVFRSPPRPLAGGTQSFGVTFARSGRQVRWSPRDGTLLAFAESLGVTMASGCRVGQCESCATTVLSGEVRHLHGAEPEDARVCLSCQAVPASELVLDA